MSASAEKGTPVDGFDAVRVVAATLKRLYPTNPDVVLGREARNIVFDLAAEGLLSVTWDGEARRPAHTNTDDLVNAARDRRRKAIGWWRRGDLDGVCDCGHQRRHHDPEDGMCDSHHTLMVGVCWCGRPQPNPSVLSTSPAADSCAPIDAGGAVSGANARDRNPR